MLEIRRWSFRAALIAVVTLGASAAHAQGTGRSMDLDPSVRSAGMGLASNAVFWDQGPDHWGNPALLGYQHGLRYEWGRSRLVPGLADDVHFTTNVIKFGGAGVGVALSGQPFGIGGLHLSYGESEGVDENGNPTGTVEPFEQIDAWSLGFSVARVAGAIATLSGHDPGAWSRYGDVSLGLTGKHLEMDFPPLGHGKTTAYDFGYLVRLSPLEWAPATRNAFLGFDVAYGWSDLSFESDPVKFSSEDAPVEVSEHERSGFAARAHLDYPSLGDLGGPPWIWEGLHPLLSVGRVVDQAEIGVSPFTYDTDSDGWEITIANVFSWRTGHYEDLVGDISDDTGGWGVGIPFGHWGGVRYDFAHIPQARGADLPDVEKRSVSGWVDALRLWRTWRQ